MYVGVQVGVASLTINYLTEQPGKNISTSQAANLYAACQASFTIGRFILVPVLMFIDPALVLFVHGVMCLVFSAMTANIASTGGIVCLFIVFFFEGVCYPIIFTLATGNLGSYQKLGSSLVAAGVSGGAAWPAIQATVADHTSSANSFHIPIIGFAVVAMYGLYMHVDASRKLGRWAWRKAANEEIKAVIANVDQIHHNTYGDAEKASSSSNEKLPAQADAAALDYTR